MQVNVYKWNFQMKWYGLLSLLKYIAKLLFQKE